MLVLKDFPKIYLYRPYIDFRKGIHGLASIIQGELELNLFESTLFVFCSRNKNKIKVLYWDKTGLALWYKVLAKDKFIWPCHGDSHSLLADPESFRSFLLGLDPWRKTHEAITYTLH